MSYQLLPWFYCLFQMWSSWPALTVYSSLACAMPPSTCGSCCFKGTHGLTYMSHVCTKRVLFGSLTSKHYHYYC